MEKRRGESESEREMEKRERKWREVERRRGIDWLMGSWCEFRVTL